MISRISTALLALFAISSLAAAQEQYLDVTTTVQKQEVVTTADGEQSVRLVSAETVVPGETVVYTITFRNISDESAENVVITNPLAAELTYVDGSATSNGADVQFSIDGGATFATRSDLVIDVEGGARAPEVKEFTHIRWVMQEELAAGAQNLVRFAAVLD